MITQPENLSKDRLKSELKKHGIRFNNSENKPYYVQLYREKVQVGPAQSQASEFSDDDYKPTKPSKKKLALSASRRKQSKALETYLIHVQTLSNNELMEGLIRMGEDPGPINPSTRSVYERKLAKLLEEEKIERENSPPRKSPPRKSYVVKASPASPVAAEDSFIGEWSDDEAEDEEEEDSIGADYQDDEIVVPEPVRSRQYNLRRRHGEDEHDDDSSRHRHESLLSQKPRRASPPRSPPKIKPSSPLPRPQKRKRRMIPEEGSDACRIVWSILFVLIVFTTVFLLYEHFTVPSGKTSLLVAGVEGVRTTVYGMIAPLMEKQVAESESGSPVTPPPPASEEPPPQEEQKQAEKTPPPTEPPKTKPTAKPETAQDKPATPPKASQDKPPKASQDKPPKASQGKPEASQDKPPKASQKTGTKAKGKKPAT